MTTTRRQMMMFAGGSAVGVLMTPAPWRLITDTALLSENWPGIPRPARGAVSARFTNCALCTAGCAVRARCIGEQPVSLAGVPSHPVSRGAMCAFGLAGHHLPYHPSRVKEGSAGKAAAAVADGIARCAAGEHVAVLDLRPGRTASWTYRRAMAAVKNGVYLAPPQAFGADVAVDLSQARTVLSFGVPVVDGWGTPGNVIAARPGFRLIQVEAMESQTASMADEWLRIRPGTEEALASALLAVVEGREQDVSTETGVSAAQVHALSKQLVERGPAVVLSEQPSAAIVQLNERLKSPGSILVARRETPVPENWSKAAPVSMVESVADASIRVLLIDESSGDSYLPWSLIQPKLVRENAVIVAMGWSREGYARHAQFMLPVAVFPETTEDIPPAEDSVTATFRMTAPLMSAPQGVVKPEEFVAAAAGLVVSDTLRERSDAIHKAARGTLVASADGKQTSLKELKAEELWKGLSAGGWWIDDADKPPKKAAPANIGRPTASAKAGAEQGDLPLAVVLTGDGVLGSPILSKIYQESNLQLGPGRIAMHPDSARDCGVADGARVVFQTLAGKYDVSVLVDAAVPRNAVLVAAVPAVRDICPAGARAKVVRV